MNVTKLEWIVVAIAVLAICLAFIFIGIASRRRGQKDRQNESMQAELDDRYERISKAVRSYKWMVLLGKPRESVHSILSIEDEIGELKISLDRMRTIEKFVATDVFVEKAQFHLTARANISFWCGIGSFIACLAICISCLVWIELHSGDIATATSTKTSSLGVVFMIMRALGVSAIFLAGIYLTASLGRSFLHEWSVLMNRRHSIRFGRLVVYLNDAKVKIDDLPDVFGWNIATSSSFAKISPEFVTKGIIGQITGAFEKGVEVASKAAEKTSK